MGLLGCEFGACAGNGRDGLAARFVGTVSGLGQLDIGLEFLFVVGNTVGEHDADVLVEIKAPLGGTAYVEMDKVTESWLALGVCHGRITLHYWFRDGS